MTEVTSDMTAGCWTWVEIQEVVAEISRVHEGISREAIENAVRARLAEEGAFMEKAEQRYGN